MRHAFLGTTLCLAESCNSHQKKHGMDFTIYPWVLCDMKTVDSTIEICLPLLQKDKRSDQIYRRPASNQFTVFKCIYNINQCFDTRKL